MKEEEKSVERACTAASLLSLLSMALSAVVYALIVADIEKSLDDFELQLLHLSVHFYTCFTVLNLVNEQKDKNVMPTQETSSELAAALDSLPAHPRSRRQFFGRPMIRSRYQQEPIGGLQRTTTLQQWETAFGRGANRQESPDNREINRMCDCSVTRCPAGPRGAMGLDGYAALDGLPGAPGRPGTDGVFLTMAVPCDPCPQGKKGEPGPPGERGARGRPGPPGKDGTDGTNELGPVGPRGPRGQPGMTGKPGMNGHPGQDSILLIGQPGKKGPVGPPGLPGPRGDPGANGEPAPPGKEGPPGPQGEAGDMGEYGPRGRPGPPGIQGENGGYCQCPDRYPTIATTTQRPLSYPISQSKQPDFDYEDRDRDIDTDRDRNTERPNVIPSIPMTAVTIATYTQTFTEPFQRNDWKPTTWKIHNPTYIAPRQDYRKKYPMISYRNSDEDKEHGWHKRSSTTSPRPSSKVEFDLRR